MYKILCQLSKITCRILTESVMVFIDIFSFLELHISCMRRACLHELSLSNILDKMFLAAPAFWCSLTLSWQRFLPYKNHSIDFLFKSMDWFLYDRDFRRERVKKNHWILSKNLLKAIKVAIYHCNEQRIHSNNYFCNVFTLWSLSTKLQTSKSSFTSLKDINFCVKGSLHTTMFWKYTELFNILKLFSSVTW